MKRAGWGAACTAVRERWAKGISFEMGNPTLPSSRGNKREGRKKKGKSIRKIESKEKGKERRGEGSFHKAEERARIIRRKRQIPKGFDFKSHNAFVHSAAALQTACLYPNA